MCASPGCMRGDEAMENCRALRRGPACSSHDSGSDALGKSCSTSSTVRPGHPHELSRPLAVHGCAAYHPRKHSSAILNPLSVCPSRMHEAPHESLYVREHAILLSCTKQPLQPSITCYWCTFMPGQVLVQEVEGAHVPAGCTYGDHHAPRLMQSRPAALPPAAW